MAKRAASVQRLDERQAHHEAADPDGLPEVSHAPRASEPVSGRTRFEDQPGAVPHRPDSGTTPARSTAPTGGREENRWATSARSTAAARWAPTPGGTAGRSVPGKATRPVVPGAGASIPDIVAAGSCRRGRVLRIGGVRDCGQPPPGRTPAVFARLQPARPGRFWQFRIPRGNATGGVDGAGRRYPRPDPTHYGVQTRDGTRLRQAVLDQRPVLHRPDRSPPPRSALKSSAPASVLPCSIAGCVRAQPWQTPARNPCDRDRAGH